MKEEFMVKYYPTEGADPEIHFCQGIDKLKFWLESGKNGALVSIYKIECVLDWS